MAKIGQKLDAHEFHSRGVKKEKVADCNLTLY